MYRNNTDRKAMVRMLSSRLFSQWVKAVGININIDVSISHKQRLGKSIINGNRKWGPMTKDVAVKKLLETRKNCLKDTCVFLTQQFLLMLDIDRISTADRTKLKKFAHFPACIFFTRKSSIAENEGLLCASSAQHCCIRSVTGVVVSPCSKKMIGRQGGVFLRVTSDIISEKVI